MFRHNGKVKLGFTLKSNFPLNEWINMRDYRCSNYLIIHFNLDLR